MSAVSTTRVVQGGQFFENLDQICSSSRLVIDRPEGSEHPRVPGAIYPVDYGYLEGTIGGDRDGIDVFRGHAHGIGVVGVFLTADLQKRDVEVKILMDCSNEDVNRIQHLLGTVLEIGGMLVRRDSEADPLKLA